MRVTIAIHSISLGGAERIASSIANGLSRRKHVVDVITLDAEGGQPAFTLDCSVQQVKLNGDCVSKTVAASIFNTCKRIRSIRQALRKTRPSIIISFIGRMNAIVGVASLGLGIPLVVYEVGNPIVSFRNRMLRWLRFGVYCFARVIAVETDHARQFYPSYLQRKTVLVAPPVILQPSEEVASYREYQPFILAVGRLHKEKNHQLLIRAFSQLVNDHPGWRLLIVGEGPQEKEICGLISHLSLTNRAILIGKVENITDLYDQADIFALSSLNEGMPTALIEAMMSGVAVVSTDCPYGPAELIQHTRNGILVPNGDADSLSEALRDLIRNPGKRKELSREAKLISSKYSVDCVIATWEKMLLDLASISHQKLEVR